MQRKSKHLRLSNLTKKESENIQKKIQVLSEVLKSRRKILDISQEHLAEKLNLSVGTIKSIEQNIRTPSLVTLLRISDELGLNFSLE